ncbi:MAG: hypothetical protein ACR2PA_15295 [Hyphomicrobiaceae bacterium]
MAAMDLLQQTRNRRNIRRHQTTHAGHVGLGHARASGKEQACQDSGKPRQLAKQHQHKSSLLHSCNSINEMCDQRPARLMSAAAELMEERMNLS